MISKTLLFQQDLILAHPTLKANRYPIHLYLYHIRVSAGYSEGSTFLPTRSRSPCGTVDVSDLVPVEAGEGRDVDIAVRACGGEMMKARKEPIVNLLVRRHEAVRALCDMATGMDQLIFPTKCRDI